MTPNLIVDNIQIYQLRPCHNSVSIIKKNSLGHVYDCGGKFKFLYSSLENLASNTAILSIKAKTKTH